MIGSKAKRIIARDKKVITGCVTRAVETPFVAEQGKGVHLFDADGKKYLDFGAGIAVMNIGYNNPKVYKAVCEQAKKLSHVGFSDFYSEVPVTLAEKLTKLTKYDQVFFSNSGTEAIETAIKAAMWHKKRKALVGFYGGFHGRTLGSLSITKTNPLYNQNFPKFKVAHSLYCNPYRCTFKDCDGVQCAEHLDKILKKEINADEVAAVVIEPIQGEGGYVIPPKAFHQEIRRICDKHGLLLIADEVQSGMFRTGEFLAMQNFKVKPDIVAMAKGIGGGFPLGATLASKKIFDWPKGAHANTFGGNLVGCRASLEAIKILEKKKDHIKRMGKFAIKRLKEMQQKHSLIGDVRGIGLMIGVEFVKDRLKTPAVKERSKVIAEAFNRGLLLIQVGKSSIRIAPPLTITKQELDKGLDILEESIKVVNQQ